MIKRRLVTSALPYVNNIPHLGNLIQVLSADVFARFCRLRGYETLYVCGTDEYGTATETRALQEGVHPKELCDRYYEIHRDIYQWFNIQFDRFGRTSSQKQTEIVQSIFKEVDQAGYIREAQIEQLYCTVCDRFLADRYVHGICPHCGYEDARGDQCEHCGKLLDPADLHKPVCGICHNPPETRGTKHLYLNLPAILPKLQAWMDEASVKGFWARNAIQMTKSWIRDGLKERCITRDLKWGIPVPKEGFEDKVFYVWFDAPIGYISITANHTDQWESWWKNPDEVELFQFIGKDNIPFHTVIFPSTLLATGEQWTMLHHMSSSEYLNYETGKFSKSKGSGVFGNDVQDTGIPADVWRFYIFYNRPEKADITFTWDDFQEKVNGELIGNLSNLVNRTLSFINRFYDGAVPSAEVDSQFSEEVTRREEQIAAHLERAELRDALREIFSLASFGNKAFQDGQPWVTRKEEPEKAESLLMHLVYLVRDLAVMISPFIPESSNRILQFLSQEQASWSDLQQYGSIKSVNNLSILFKHLEDDQIASLRSRFSGTQEERKQKAADDAAGEDERNFNATVDLRVAKITQVERHPEADKLYIETIEFGEGEQRQIVSGLVPFYRDDELLGRNIIVVYNLKPAKLRGVKSQGMLLAASAKDGEGQEQVEVLFADWAQPGEQVTVEGLPAPEEEKKRIKIDQFFAIPLKVIDSQVMVGGKRLTVGGSALRTGYIPNGEVG
ncbi:MAG: methionine--tRNA ligase [Spirochaetota bacterium]